jgi:thiamine biosynthesis lipoprotein
MAAAPSALRAPDRVGTASWVAWTTQCRLVVSDVTLADIARARAGELMEDIARAIDRYDPASEVSRLRRGVNPVSPLLAWFLRVALDAAERTGGLLDPAYRAGMGAWRELRLDDDQLWMPVELDLDLGSTGKAAAADLLAARLQRELGCDVLVSLGGDIATAGGPVTGWQVDVQDAATDPVAFLSLLPGAAVATSSTLHRTRTGGGAGHHIVDPRTGESAKGPWRSVTVVAPRCADANAAAAAAIIQGPDAVDRLADLGLPCRLVGYDGQVRCLDGFPEQAS